MDKWDCKCQAPGSSSFPDSSEFQPECDPNGEIEYLVMRENRQSLHEIALGVQNNISDEDLEKVFDWLYDVIQEAGCHTSIFSHAALLTRRFLSRCPVRTNQLQLLATTCLVLASKVRAAKHPRCSIPVQELVLYTDNAVTLEEIKTWEKLILSKLDWNVSLVVAEDYLQPVSRQLRVGQTSSITSEDLINEIVKNATVAIVFVERTSQDFCRKYVSPRLVSCAGIILAVRACQSSTEKAESGKTAEEKVLSEEVMHRLGFRSDGDVAALKTCSDDLESILMKYVEEQRQIQSQSPGEGTTTPPSPPQTHSAGSSPFKICSSSTPKRLRYPLRDGSNIPVPRFRLRLGNSLQGQEVEGEPRSEDVANKENNDSAIGMNVSFTSGSSPSAALSPVPSSSSSSTSSPDSGASSGSPKSRDVDELETILTKTSIHEDTEQSKSFL